MMTQIFTGDTEGDVAITEEADGTYTQIERRVSSLKKGWHLVIDKKDGQSLFCARLSDEFDSMWMLWEVFCKAGAIARSRQSNPFLPIQGKESWDVHEHGGSR